MLNLSRRQCEILTVAAPAVGVAVGLLFVGLYLALKG